MYLDEPSVDSTLATIRDFAGKGSEIAFDHVYSSVIRREGRYFGEREISERVEKAGEAWTFGIEEGGLGDFARAHGFDLVDCLDSAALESRYFEGEDGRIVGKVKGAHRIARFRK